ncbi:flagellar assembly protein FliX [Methyloraptor flagellatus]|jgi:hypothetical protein|uniref:Flagellar assembly protein FliX n=1 Tax=Methyloraptor flagellatus TaxID=3162530 RepID=A0AAU7XC92_9HYPH
MRIDGTGRPTTIQTGTSVRRPAGAEGGFTLPSETQDAKAAPVAVGLTGVADLASLIALQQVDNPLERRRRSVKRGFDLLDVLEGVKIDLLSGNVSEERLDRLVHLLGQRQSSGDEKLDALMADIELRARVELAKFGKYPD